MIKSLYKCFRHWSSTGSVYIISDPHFMDTDMNWRASLIPTIDIEEKYYPDKRAAQIAEYLVEKINKVCNKNDTLIILGDIGDISYIPKLKAGYKVLIKGNHDLGSSKYKRQQNKINTTLATNITEARKMVENTVDFYLTDFYKTDNTIGYEPVYNILLDNKLFDEVYEGPLFISDRILLSHEPIVVVPPCCLNIHGHTHSELNDESDGFMCVCCEKIGFTPINLGEYIKNGAISDINSIHRFTIDRATTNKKNKEKNV